MGSLKGLNLVDALAKQNTFMKLARTATKGKAVLKNQTLSGKAVIDFFDNTPVMQNVVQSISSDNLVVRYGTKAGKKVSVTGFQLFDGEFLLAKGVLGLDKVRGKKPIVQARVQFNQFGQKSSININYNANEVFNGNIRTSSVEKEEKFIQVFEYGNTLSYRYAGLSTLAPHISKIPTNGDFLKPNSKFTSLFRDFITGKRRIIPRSKVVSRMNMEDSSKKSSSFVNDLMLQYEIRMQACRDAILADIQNLRVARNNITCMENELSQKTGQIEHKLQQGYVDLDSAREVEKQLLESLRNNMSTRKFLQNEIAKKIEIGRQSSFKYSVEKQSERRIIVELPQYKIANQKYACAIYQKNGLLDVDVASYSNKEVVKQLKTIKGPLQEKVLQIRDVFAKEKGIEASLVNIRAMSDSDARALAETPFVFNPVSGLILYNPNKMKSLSYVDLCSYVCHEMKHLEDFSKLAKFMGMKKFKALCLKDVPKEQLPVVKKMFNEEFYKKMIKQVKLDDFDAEGFEQSFRQYQSTLNTSNILEYLKSRAQYFESILEVRAWDAQFRLQKSMGKVNRGRFAERELCLQFGKEIKRIEASAPKGFCMELLVNDILQTLVLQKGEQLTDVDILCGLLNGLKIFKV